MKKKKTVLIIGSGGKNKYDYLEWLEKLGATVVLLEPDIKHASSIKYETYFVPFTRLDAVVEKAKEIAARHSIETVDTIFELAMEPAALVRKTLGFFGLTPEFVRIGRSKISMAEFMSRHGIRVAPYITFSNNDNLKAIQEKMKIHGNGEWILRPDDLGSNIGVRKIKKDDDFRSVFESAKYDVTNHHFRSFVFKETNTWIASHYINGYELEAEICIHKGDIIFLCTFLKTVNLERDSGFEENRCVTPIPWLTDNQLEDMNIQIRNLAKVVYQEIMKPCGRETMIVYAEFRLDKNNQAHVLEFAFRNGGYLNPVCIEKSTGVSPYYLSAAATLNLEVKLKEALTQCASGYQSLYSDRKGRFEGIKGIQKLPGIVTKEEVPFGHKIAVPHSEILMNVVATAPTPEEVDGMLNSALRRASVIVDGVSISIPLSAFHIENFFSKSNDVLSQRSFSQEKPIFQRFLKNCM